ncbi:DUF2530 domain-containing protein [Cutibacterium avidum]|uniref:DUF2530 domain-containing protein n=1 Tax=Cutibacterium avidum TaxID=33010 RepID=UPI00192BE925|nr:DUF2530 domain-containing protein [Cutibacterium avidum]QQY14131.1 DUF2530 domain-containing protein [Cutibacterium avidum]
MTCHGHVAGHYDGTVTNQREHLLTQANVAPVDENGVTVGIVGTIAFAVASIVCWIMLDRLTVNGYRDWLWICLTGTALGIVGTAYCWRRSRH